MTDDRRTVLVVLGVVGCMALGALIAGRVWWLGTLLAAGIWLLLVVGALGGTAVGLSRRITASAAMDTSLDDEDDEKTPPLELMGAISLATGAAGLIAAGAGLIYILPPTPIAPWMATTAGAATAAGAGVLWTVGRYYAGRHGLPEGAPLARWFRGAVGFTAVTAASLLARGLAEPWFEVEISLVLFALVLVVSAEATLRALPALWRWWRFTEAAPPQVYLGLNLLTVRLFLSRANPVASVFDALDATFGIDLRGTWALTFLRRSVEPLALAVAVLGWLSTGLVMVHPHEQGLVERFGRALSGPPLEPGLHVVFPWPIDEVARVPVRRVFTMKIGHEEAGDDDDDDDGSRLWAKQHADEEYTLLLGDGRDLVTIDGLLHYRIADPRAWRYHTGNPTAALRSVAYKAVMDRTINHTLEAVLSENLTVFAEDVLHRVQAEADNLDLGVEVVDFTLEALHPPVAVAVDYQAVVSAQIDKQTRTVRAQAYAARTVPGARADATRAVHQATAGRTERVAAATGEAEAFAGLRATVRTDEGLYRLRRRTEAVESNLAGRPLIILDHRFERDGGQLWLTE